MNLTKFNETEATMSSKEIAELTSKRHDKVLFDIRNVLEQAGIDPTLFRGVYKDQQLIDRPCFNLPRRECDLVISGYSVQYRLKIIDRWRELESKEQKPMTTMEMVIASAQHIQKLEQEQERQAEAIKALEAKQAATDCDYGYYSILAYAKLKGRKITPVEAARLGKSATAISKKYGITTGTVPDARYGSVGTYDEGILEELFAKDEYNENS